MRKLNNSEFHQMIKKIYEEEKEILKSKKVLKEDISGTILNYVQTALDYLGIVDPTPISDTINGFIYWFRGDRLFAFLTWISALPFLGDALAKPAVLTLKNLKSMAKVGGTSEQIIGVSDNVIKEIENALDAGDVQLFTKLVDENGGGLKNIVQNFENPNIFSQILEKLNTIKSVGKRIPFLGGFITVIDEWTDIFTKASRQLKSSKELSDYLTKAAKMGIKPLTDLEKKILTQELNTINRYRGFSEYVVNDPKWWNRYYDGGFGRLYGNRDMRSLMNRTKWYLGLLDWLNMGNYIGSDKLENEVPNLKNQIELYDQTEIAKDLASDDLSGEVNMFDKITKIIPQSFMGDEIKTKIEVDPLNVLFSITGL